MIPPSPLQFTLLGSALYTELAAGLWRALAAPWLEPGWSCAARALHRPGAADPAPLPRPDGAAGPVADARRRARAGASEPAPTAKPCEGRVIDVPRARWQRRRGHGGRTATED